MWSGRHHRPTGGTWDKHVCWGDRYQSIDYAASELTIGDLHFRRSDMGYEIQLAMHPRAALGENDKMERDQCVCAKLALVMEWDTQGRPRRISNKGRAMSLATQIRIPESQQAQMLTRACDKPTTNRSAEVFALARDSTSPHHERNFQDINLFLSGAETTTGENAARISDLESVYGRAVGARISLTYTNSAAWGNRRGSE